MKVLSRPIPLRMHRRHLLYGNLSDVLAAGLMPALAEWEDDLRDLAETGDRNQMIAAVLADPEYAAFEFTRLKNQKETDTMPTIKKNQKQTTTFTAPTKLTLPTGRSEPVDNPWNYAYLITGEKKIGKTAFSIEGCEELVLQFDKPQLAYAIREIVIKSWSQFKDVLRLLEEKAKDGEAKFPYQRIVVDGAGEWYQMCQQATCKKFGVEHPSEEGYARAWHYLRDEFTDSVNRLLRLQREVGCGMIFIAHAEWKEKNTRDGGKIERLVPNLPPRAEEILNGKCDAWFAWDYAGKDRIMVVQGDEITGAGHRIDGHFLTADGRRVREIYMGESPKEALNNFMRAFNNAQEYETVKEFRKKTAEPAKGSTQESARRVVRKSK